ncbi:hypothetical protein BDY19DRAFT_938323 [Irpex rosettiformis]|uniref:Uncharacterized protein n=1 Tax=Irpex rosettiformis TaxID=378272 RepID=A0ACB8U787_9APHY|nr:hypothetical protein BDY19DRAFT_938323 [Irpex rosettiformis]
MSIARRKRMSVSSARSVSPLSPYAFQAALNPDMEEWVKAWESVPARDLIDSPVIAVDSDTSVEDACEALLSKNVTCIAINRVPSESPHDTPYLGLFDYPDVNAFLTLAATRHRWSPEELRGKPRTEEIIAAAKAGRVPVRLVSNLSEKNPLEVLPHDATIISLLTIFSKGTHRVLIRAPSPSDDFLGFVSDKSLLEWFTTAAQNSPTLGAYVSVSLSNLALPSLYLYTSVIATKASDSVLDAMRLMSDYGVSSVAVIEEEGGNLLSAISVTDIGKIVVPSQSSQILSMPLHQLISLIKEPDGSTDGADKYPVYTVMPNNTLLYTMQKILATNSHRLFVSDDHPTASPSGTGCLSGVVSIVDVLSLFGRLANLPDVDPTAMQRHRRASSVSSESNGGPSGRSPDHYSFPRSRSSSRTGLTSSGSFVRKRTSVSSISVSPGLPASVSPGHISHIPSLESMQTHWAERVPK